MLKTTRIMSKKARNYVEASTTLWTMFISGKVDLLLRRSCSLVSVADLEEAVVGQQPTQSVQPRSLSRYKLFWTTCMVSVLTEQLYNVCWAAYRKREPYIRTWITVFDCSYSHRTFIYGVIKSAKNLITWVLAHSLSFKNNMLNLLFLFYYIFVSARNRLPFCLHAIF